MNITPKQAQRLYESVRNALRLMDMNLPPYEVQVVSELMAEIEAANKPLEIEYCPIHERKISVSRRPLCCNETCQIVTMIEKP